MTKAFAGLEELGRGWRKGYTSGFRTTRLPNLPKSRSAVHSC